ncbi:IS110 family transposase [Rubrobacter indicoceani]|uniref:IS110 family transposase n=1 Tax=Rubrobacter indicoceani TaxID=2051957 RepID=UPI00196975D9|nr:IS110 family transposase [Rubrobacter indicoceani]
MQQIYIGVDTHSDFHVAVALDSLGRHTDHLKFPNTSKGFSDLLSWSTALGLVVAFGVEGTGSYGSSLSRTLSSNGYTVLEVSRPSRQYRRRRGKSDLTDAESAARSLLSGLAFLPKSHHGPVDSLRTLKLARTSAMKSRTQATNQLRSILVTGPLELVEDLRLLHLQSLLKKCSSYRTPNTHTSPEHVTKTVLKQLSRRHQSLTAEISAFDETIRLLVDRVTPELLSIQGIGIDTASSLLVAIGDNPDRLRSESSFAHLCGVAPLPASSGKTTRHRLNRGGNRDANRALHVVALVRMAHDQRTREYVAKRTSEGKSKKEIIRCLKRYISREVFRVIRMSRISQSTIDNL